MTDNEISGTKDPTFHRILLDTRFELPLGGWCPHTQAVFALLSAPGLLMSLGAGAEGLSLWPQKLEGCFGGGLCTNWGLCPHRYP